ncbi:Transcriptional activator FeaR [Brevundimonas subvibrioides]|uniref:Transcriptional regulator, AraC family n=1 Tax=Brevundimonas subvibrioides (strain ATCC 15264 / DSM 4735 / LMG 14903 / NBRC 16000 / CB 81) TaxID=633149 RepID=D9QIM8_BRESC|nr:helix-turn-helix domain-containing protein [Brevundimonas subvibrioides]ADL01361.1 transcriptional regulator, AraC family [Brevundimonas subvibrioides ATCC 15264]
MESFSTAGLPAARRSEAWNKLYSSHLNHVDFIPADRSHFNAELSMSRLGPIGLARMAADSSSIERTRHHITVGSPRLYTFVLQTRGEGELSHCGHEARLEAGDFTLCDSSAPHFFRVNDNSEVLMLRVPAETLRVYVPSPEVFCGQLLKGNVGLTGTAAAMIRSLASQAELGIPSPYDQRVARNLLEVMATSYALAFDDQIQGSSVVRGRQACIVRHIEANLRDPGLSPASIAAALRISPRYLRLVFATGNETVSGYILRRRLEECARQIQEPGWTGHTLTEVAFSWGFNSSSHFARSFRDRFGVPPRQYRRSGLTH